MVRARLLTLSLMNDTYTSLPQRRTRTRRRPTHPRARAGPAADAHRPGRAAAADKLARVLLGEYYSHAASVLNLTGKNAIYLVFSDLPVKLEGLFRPRDRFFDLFSRTAGSDDVPVLAQCLGVQNERVSHHRGEHGAHEAPLTLGHPRAHPRDGARGPHVVRGWSSHLLSSPLCGPVLTNDEADSS
ncbi:hypothetical protein DFH11DRAFT_165971 [Phellopilus nigrolimitatus]|nr:hypothetical protein DFH11DRAFT_165971 [Phellopilus nigrolimitatus]